MRCGLQRLLAVGAIVVLGSGQRAMAVDAAMQARINAAIKRGVAYLQQSVTKEGTWIAGGVAPQAKGNDTELGATALVGLTLLECDVPRTDKQVLQAAAAIREWTVTTRYTYSLSLAIMFLDRLGDPADVPLIESMTVRLMAGQSRSGGWSYSCPEISAAEMKRLLSLAREKNELVAKGQLPKAGDGKRRSRKDLPRQIREQLEAAKNGGGDEVPPGDNSNTQFATMALWISRRHALPADDTLDRCAASARAGQTSKGGWEYQRYLNAGAGRNILGNFATPSMTCSGLLQLAVGNGLFNEKIMRQKGARAAVDPANDKSIRFGMKALADFVGNPSTTGKGSPPIQTQEGEEYYYLWSLERVAMVYSLERIGARDWYLWGSQILLAKQDGGGSWSGKYGQNVDTCFALLFLRRSNLFGDLTASLRGKRKGANVLESVRRDKIKGEKVSNKLVNPNNKPEPKDGKAPVVKPKDIDAKEQAAETARLRTELVQAPPEKQEDLVQGLEKGKGAQYTDALATAIPLLKGETKEKARQALMRRMLRLKEGTLRDKLEDESAEVRQAAAAACARKMAKALVPDLIKLLEDPELPVAEAAHSSLKELTDKDFGPQANATKAERKDAVTQWKAWWKSQRKE
jgi:hypothetical protein